MFKSRKKRQQLKEAAAAAALEANTQSEIKSEIETNSKYKLLDDIHLTHDFRSSIILPQLNKDLDPVKLSKQQLHLAQLRDIPESPTMSTTQPPLSPPPLKDLDGTKQYQELAAWRHQRSQNRYSNGLFGGKQRGRPKPSQLKKYAHDEEDDIAEEETQAPAITNNDLPTPPLTVSITTTTTTNPAPFQSIINQLHEEDDSENDDIEEEDEEELLEELYEPNSDTEENFFFKDFSSNPTSNTKKKSTPRRKSRSNKVMSKFDLSSFARDLHDNRLSVMVQRESRIIMTEDDELELEKLLERQRQRMSMMSTMVSESSESLVVPPPPMPSLDLIKSHQNATTTIYRPVSPNNKKEESNKIEVEQSLEVPHMNSDHGSTTTTDSNSCTSNEDHHDITKEITLKDDVPQKITTPIPVKSLSSSRSSNSIITHSSSSPKVNIDQLKRSVSTNSVQSNHTPIIRKRSNLSPIKDTRRDTERSSARKSVSMDDIHINLKENEHSVTSAALDWINQTENTTPLTPTSDPTSFVYKQGSTTPSTTPTPQLSKSRSLFGSLRQVSRSKSHHHSGNGGGIKGLVRNFSSHHKPSSTSANSDAGMSRAAMAVIQHNVAKQEKQKATPVIPEEPPSETTVTTPPQPPKRRSRSKSDANNNANNLISHLISRAASSRKHNGTKIVNMENDDAAKKRAQVVRKTIIYVQPDSLHNLLKNGGDGSSIKVPPMPSRINTSSTTGTRNTLALSDGSLSPDDETVRSREYVTATKIVRQTSVRKRVVENDTSDSKSAASSPLSETSTLVERKGSTNTKKRYQLQSVDEHDLLSIHHNKHTSSSSNGSSSGSSNHSANNNNEYMEGLELREMSDGSVVWGLVKKQGNRKSFFAPNQLHHGHYDHVDDEEDEVLPSRNMKQAPQHHHNNSLSPPPIPKRSPRRQVTPAPATDVYYSNQVNLPNLLKMMYDQQQQHPGDDSNDDDDQYEFNERAMSSVDDQLDEMMRILTSQQQQVQQH